MSAKIKLNTADGIEYWIIKTLISKLSILKKLQITELIIKPYVSLMQLNIISLFIFIIFVSASLCPKLNIIKGIHVVPINFSELFIGS